MGHGLALPPDVGERQGEERPNGVVELVGAAASSSVRSATLSSARPMFRSELASWITARRRRSDRSPRASASW